MKKTIKFSLGLLLHLIFNQYGYTQTLILNEVSQGPTGNKEYVEMLVIPGNSTYNCSNYNIDLRGWILDDNNGYFSGGATSGVGIANGAIRFKNDPFWQFIPVGTIILVYNDLDLNASIPADDFSTTDGNCRLILPVSSPLFESQTVSPTTSSMTYPTTGWVSGGLWAPISMANGGDSFQIYNATNQTTPVHGVSWANNTSNTIIYFSTASATNTVFYFGNVVDDNPANQANWVSGTCSAPDDQTPGAPNNVANATYINSLTNSCAGPLAATISASADANNCQCNGSATVNATGSILGYTYAWYNSSNVSLGQATSTASNLCAGTYHCIVSSSINCLDTAYVTINSTTNTITPTFNSISPICSGGTITLPTTSLNGVTGSWSPTIDNTQTTTYTFTPDPNQCASPTTLTVVVSNGLTPTFNQIPAICSGGTITLPPSSIEGVTGTWSPSINNLQTTNYTFLPDAGQCANSASMTVNVNPIVDPQFNPWGPYCQDDILAQVILPTTSLNGITGTWNPQMVSTSVVGTSSYTFTPNSFECANMFILDVTVFPLPIINAGNDVTICEGSSVTLSASGGTQYIWLNSVSNGTPFTPTATATYYVTGTDVNGCTEQDSVVVSIVSTPVAEFSSNVISGLAPLYVQFANTSTNATNYVWNFGNGNSLSVSNLNPVNSIYNNPQNYTVWLVATNGVCKDSTSEIITVIATGEPEISIPNVFSPNGDDVNDFWFIETKNIGLIQIIIVNRWGNLIKEMDLLNETWDGKTERGEEVTDGTYFYKYSAKALNGKEFTGQGFITLVR